MSLNCRDSNKSVWWKHDIPPVNPPHPASLSVFTSLFGQDVFYVDAAAGQDSATVAGTLADPFETISYSISRSSVGNSVLVYCQPGTYNKETWPIVGTADALTVQAMLPGSVLLTTPTAAPTHFKIMPDSGDLTLRGLSVQGAQQFIRLSGSGAVGDQIHIVLEDLNIQANTALQASVYGDAYVNIDMRMCEVKVTGAGLSLVANGRTHIKANVQRCMFTQGILCGVQAEASDPSSELELNIENTVIRDFARHAVYLESAGGASNLMLNSCNLVGNGISTSTLREAVNLVRPNATSSYPHAVLMRNILSDNGGDLRDFASMPWNYTFESNLVQDAAIAGLGGNILGNADFVGNTMVLGGRSAAWGVAPVGGLSEDYYGNIRDADGRGDIGAFEHKAFTFGTYSRAPIGGYLQMAVSGPPHQPFALFAGWSTTAGPGLQVNPLSFANPGVSTTLSSIGSWSFDYLMPSSPALAGRMSFFQIEGLLSNGLTVYSQVIPVRLVYDL